MGSTEVTARKLGLVACSSCHQLCEPASGNAHLKSFCPRCGASLRSRKANSLSRSWALVVAAGIMLIPANLLPITFTSAIGSTQTDTIISGVIYFAHSGLWPIALIIFVASVFIPIVKLGTLIMLLLSVQYRWRWSPRSRTQLYRMTELVGRWSMVDVYVVTILVALVKLGAIASIDAGPGAAYFASVVILTMFAAESFDPRLIWDVLENNNE